MSPPPANVSFMPNSQSNPVYWVELSVLAGIALLLYKYAVGTDIAKIKNLPELPGVPIFGSLFLLGKHHARNCAHLVAKYGPVFQVRLGNRVSISPTSLYCGSSHILIVL
jgi:phenylacetate 2-hydroxylase